MGFDRRDQQVRIARPLIVDFVGDDNLVLRLLQFHHFAEFGGLAGLPFANDFRRRLEQADDLALGVGCRRRRRALWSGASPVARAAPSFRACGGHPPALAVAGYWWTT